MVTTPCPVLEALSFAALLLTITAGRSKAASAPSGLDRSTVQISSRRGASDFTDRFRRSTSSPRVVVFAPLLPGRCVVIGKLRGSQHPQCSLNCPRPGLDAVRLRVGVQEANFLGWETDAEFHGSSSGNQGATSVLPRPSARQVPVLRCRPIRNVAVRRDRACIWLVPGAGFEPARGCPGRFSYPLRLSPPPGWRVATGCVWGLDFLFAVPRVARVRRGPSSLYTFRVKLAEELGRLGSGLPPSADGPAC